jgi:hypothetical protein
VNAVESRIAKIELACPRCQNWILVGEVIAAVQLGSTESSACLDCAWEIEPKKLNR